MITSVGRGAWHEHSLGIHMYTNRFFLERTCSLFLHPARSCGGQSVLNGAKEYLTRRFSVSPHVSGSHSSKALRAIPARTARPLFGLMRDSCDKFRRERGLNEPCSSDYEIFLWQISCTNSLLPHAYLSVVRNSSDSSSDNIILRNT